MSAKSPAPPCVPGTSTSTRSADAGPNFSIRTLSYFAGPGPGAPGIVCTVPAAAGAASASSRDSESRAERSRPLPRDQPLRPGTAIPAS